MQSMTSRDHGVNMLGLVNITLEKNGFTAIILQKLLHLFWQLFQRRRSDTLDVHGFCKLDKVGVGHSRVRVPFLVKQILPLKNHSLELIVQDKNLSWARKMYSAFDRLKKQQR